MCLHTIKNEFLSVVISEHGAEMHSVLLDGKERLWCGDKTFWGYHAPFLFPFVGTITNGETIFDGKKYQMKQHGIARISHHNLVEIGEDYAVFAFSSSSETRKLFPHDFEYITKYTLIGKKVDIATTVVNKNKNGKELVFSVGAHTAFSTSLYDGDSCNDYEILFEKMENNLQRMFIEGPLLAGETSYPPTRKVEFTEELLEGTIILKGFESSYVSLVRKSTGESCKASLCGHDIVAFWKPMHAPFICLEPWNGVADPVNFCGVFEEKPYIQRVSDSATYDFSIEFE